MRVRTRPAARARTAATATRARRPAAHSPAARHRSRPPTDRARRAPARSAPERESARAPRAAAPAPSLAAARPTRHQRAGWSRRWRSIPAPGPAPTTTPRATPPAAGGSSLASCAVAAGKLGAHGGGQLRHLRVLAQLQCTDVGDDGPAILRRHAVGVRMHDPVAVAHHLVEVPVGRIAQPLLVVAGWAREAAPHDRAVAVADRA